MNLLPYFLLLVFLALFSFTVFVFYKYLVRKNISVHLRLSVLQTGVGLVISAPIAFIFLILAQWESVEVKVVALNSLNFAAAKSGPVILNQDGYQWLNYLAIAYLLGVLYMLARIIFSYVSARRMVADAQRSELRGRQVYLSSNVVSPFSFGFPLAKIYLPRRLASELSSRDVEMTLVHETIHIRNQDPWWKLFSLVARAILFIFPWAYFLHRSLEVEMEIRCDEETLREMNATPSEYGQLLLSLTVKLPINQVLTNMTDSTIKRRIFAMKSRTIHRPILSYLGSGLMIISAILGVALTSGATEKKTTFQLQAKITLDGVVVARPTIVTREGEEGIIMIGDDQRNDFMSLKVNMNNARMPNSDQAIGISMDLKYRKNGKSVHSTPSMIVQEGQSGAISVDDEVGSIYTIEVLAHRLD